MRCSCRSVLLPVRVAVMVKLPVLVMATSWSANTPALKLASCRRPLKAPVEVISTVSVKAAAMLPKLPGRDTNGERRAGDLIGDRPPP